MQHLDEGTIHAMLDGELPFAAREVAEAHIATCAECAAAVAEARGFIAASSRILTALDSVPGRVVPEKEKIAPGTFHTPPRITMTRRSWLRAGSAVAAVLVLVLSTITVIATRPGADAPLAKLGQHDELESVRRAPVASAPAMSAPAEQSAANAPLVADAAPAPAPVSRKMRVADSSNRAAADMVAEAAPRRPESPAVAQAAPAPASQHFADSARSRLVLGSVAVTGAGTTSIAGTLGSTVNSDSAPPTLVSRNSAIDAGDTVVTTVYDVRGVPVSLIDRSPLQANAARIEVRGARAPIATKTNGVSARVNSITWSDSTGRTRTLRGALTNAELQSLKQTLFGATP